MAFDVVRGRRPSAMGACIGAVVGLVAITPAAGYVSIGASIVIGTVASIVSNYVVHLKTKSTLDDTLDVFPCHGVGGIVGMIATGVFAREVGLVAGQSRMFLLQLAALAIAGTYTFAGSYLLYKVTDAIIPMRVPEEQERVGLDLSQHGESLILTDDVGGVAHPRRASKVCADNFGLLVAQRAHRIEARGPAGGHPRRQDVAQDE